MHLYKCNFCFHMYFLFSVCTCDCECMIVDGVCFSVGWCYCLLCLVR